MINAINDLIEWNLDGKLDEFLKACTNQELDYYHSLIMANNLDDEKIFFKDKIEETRVERGDSDITTEVSDKMREYDGRLTDLQCFLCYYIMKFYGETEENILEIASKDKEAFLNYYYEFPHKFLFRFYYENSNVNFFKHKGFAEFMDALNIELSNTKSTKNKIKK